MLHRTLTRRHGPITLSVMSLLCLSLFAAPGVQADTVGLVDGQAYDAKQFRQLTLETALRLQSDVTRTSLRITLPRLADKFVLFADGNVVQGDHENLAINGDAEYSGSGGGIGLFYSGLPDWHAMTTTLKIALHSERSESDSDLAVSGRQATVDTRLRTQALSVSFSPRVALRDNGLNGYLSLGLNKTRIRQKLLIDAVEEPRLSESNSKVRAFIETGIVYPVKRFRLYAAAGFEDTFSLSLGVRYFVSQTPGES